MSATKDYPVQAVGNRSLQLSKRDDNNYQIKLDLKRGERVRTLATLVVTPAEWAKLASVSEGLKRK